MFYSILSSGSASHCDVTDVGLHCWIKVKGNSEHLYIALYGIQTTLKRSGVDHTVLPAINTIPAVYLVSVHWMAPSPIEVANI